MICFSEIWLDEVGNSLYELSNYISKRQVRDDRKGGGVSIYINNSLRFNSLGIVSPAGDFNLNLLDHESNKEMRDFWKIIYRNGMIPTIMKPTRITRTTATALDPYPCQFFY